MSPHTPPRFNPNTHSTRPQHWRTITPQAAGFLVERIDESRWIARREPTTEVEQLRLRLLNTELRRYPVGSFVSELDALLVVAGHASFSASTLLRYRLAVFDLEGTARKLEAYRELFVQRWEKQGAPTCEVDAPHARSCSSPPDSDEDLCTSSARCP